MKIFSISFIALIIAFSCEYPEKYSDDSPNKEELYTGIEISVPVKSLYVNEETRASLLLLLSTGDKREVESEDVSWMTGDSSVLAIAEDGGITAKSAGKTPVIAVYGEYTASLEIVVSLYSKIIISEIFYDPAGSESMDESREFIEIYNDNEYSSRLSGFVLVNGDNMDNIETGDYTIPEGSIIPSKGFIVLARSFSGFCGEYGYGLDLIQLPFSPQNNGETIFLIRPDGTDDTVYIEGGAEDYPADTAWGSTELPGAEEGYSVQRVNFYDTDSYNDWAGGAPAPGE